MHKTQIQSKSQYEQGNCAYNPSPKQVASANWLPREEETIFSKSVSPDKLAIVHWKVHKQEHLSSTNLSQFF